MRSIAIVFCAILVLFSFSQTQATIIYVPGDQPTIQAGIDASSNGDTVLVALGTYYEHINFNGKNIVVASLFLTSANTSYISGTIIDGDSAGTVITITNGEDTTAQVVGFTIQHGAAQKGAGIFCENASSPIIRHNVLQNNYANQGGGIWSWTSPSPIIRFNTFISNEAGLDGGGICCWGSSATIRGNTLHENSATYGGAIYCHSSSATIVGNSIYHNSAESGGGMAFLTSSSGIVSNNTIDANEAVSGGGIYIQASSPSIRNSIVTNSPSGSGIWGATTTVYCDVWNNLEGDYVGGTPGEGCISADPLFCDPESDDYRLHRDSPCLGAGEGGLDVGAYGLGCVYLDVTPGPDQSDTATTDVSVIFYLQNAGDSAYVYDVNASNSLGWSLYPLYHEVTLDSNQLDSVAFTVTIPQVLIGTVNRVFVDVISQTDSVDWDSASLTVTCIAFMESVQVTAGSDQSGYADSVVPVAFLIQNAGVVPDSYSVDISDVQGWGINPAHYDLFLGTAETDSAIITVSIPLVSPGTSDSVTLVAISKSNPLAGDSATLIVTCNAYKESVQVTAGDDQSGYADSIVSVIFLIENAGVVVDSYDVDISDVQGWGINPAHYDLFLGTAETDSAIITVSIPLVSPGTSDSVTLVAISKSNYLVRDSATLVVTCSAYKESVQVAAGDDQSGYADSIVSVIFLIENAGVVVDSYDVDISGVQGWEVSPPHYDLVLDTAETQAVSFTVAIPYVPLGTRDTLTLIAASKSNPIILDSAFLTVTCSSYVEGLSLDPGSDISLTANTQIQAPIIVHNTGLAPDSFNLILTDSLGWNIQPTSRQITVAAGEEDTAFFDIQVPDVTVGTMNRLFLFGESLTNPFIADSGSILLVCTSRILRVPADFGTIQAAINFSSDGDSILVAPDTYYEHPNFNGKAIVLKSEDGALSTILSMLAGGVSMVRFISGEDSNSVLDGFTITGAFLEVGQGAGIRCQNSSPKIVNNRIVDNSCPYGAGIDCDNYSSPIIANNVIEQNPATSSGGGIRCNNHSSPVIRENLIIDNSAAESGGGIWCEDNCSPTIVGNLIAQNTAGTGYGGGIGLLNSSVADIINSTVDANSASTGGGIYIGATSSATIQNTIVTNTTSGKGVRHDGASPIFLYYCDVWNNLDQDYYGCLPADGCISADPVYCDPEDGDYSLWAGSPCLGAGQEGTDIGAFGEGCSGVGDANADGEVNIGDVVYLVSYLYKGGPAPTPAPAGDVNCDGLINVGDVVYLVNYLFKGGPPPCEP